MSELLDTAVKEEIKSELLDTAVKEEINWVNEHKIDENCSWFKRKNLKTVDISSIMPLILAKGHTLDTQ